MAHLIIFEHVNFRGAHRHFFQNEDDLAASDDKFFNDKISSFVVLDGRWRFYEHKNRGGAPSNVFARGYYPSVQQAGISNDSISSIQLIGE